MNINTTTNHTVKQVINALLKPNCDTRTETVKGAFNTLEKQFLTKNSFLLCSWSFAAADSDKIPFIKKVESFIEFIKDAQLDKDPEIASLMQKLPRAPQTSSTTKEVENKTSKAQPKETETKEKASRFQVIVDEGKGEIIIKGGLPYSISTEVSSHINPSNRSKIKTLRFQDISEFGKDDTDPQAKYRMSSLKLEHIDTIVFENCKLKETFCLERFDIRTDLALKRTPTYPALKHITFVDCNFDQYHGHALKVVSMFIEFSKVLETVKIQRCNDAGKKIIADEGVKFVDACLKLGYSVNWDSNLNFDLQRSTQPKEQFTPSSAITAALEQQKNNKLKQDVVAFIQHILNPESSYSQLSIELEKIKPHAVTKGIRHKYSEVFMADTSDRKAIAKAFINLVQSLQIPSLVEGSEFTKLINFAMPAEGERKQAAEAEKKESSSSKTIESESKAVAEAEQKESSLGSIVTMSDGKKYFVPAATSPHLAAFRKVVGTILVIDQESDIQLPIRKNSKYPQDGDFCVYYHSKTNKFHFVYSIDRQKIVDEVTLRPNDSSNPMEIVARGTFKFSPAKKGLFRERISDRSMQLFRVTTACESYFLDRAQQFKERWNWAELQFKPVTLVDEYYQLVKEI